MSKGRTERRDGSIGRLFTLSTLFTQLRAFAVGTEGSVARNKGSLQDSAPSMIGKTLVGMWCLKPHANPSKVSIARNPCRHWQFVRFSASMQTLQKTPDTLF